MADMEAQDPAFRPLKTLVQILQSVGTASPEIEEKLQAVRLERDELESVGTTQKDARSVLRSCRYFVNSHR